jgi:hypothetical protein
MVHCRPSDVREIYYTRRNRHLLVDASSERLAIRYQQQARCPIECIIVRPVIWVSSQDEIPPSRRYLVAFLAHPIVDKGIKATVLREVAHLQTRIPSASARRPAK